MASQAKSHFTSENGMFTVNFCNFKLLSFSTGELLEAKRKNYLWKAAGKDPVKEDIPIRVNPDLVILGSIFVIPVHSFLFCIKLEVSVNTFLFEFTTFRHY